MPGWPQSLPPDAPPRSQPVNERVYQAVHRPIPPPTHGTIVGATHPRPDDQDDLAQLGPSGVTYPHHRRPARRARLLGPTPAQALGPTHNRRRRSKPSFLTIADLARPALTQPT